MNSLQIQYEACPLCKSQSTSIGAANCSRYSNWHEPLPSTLEWMKCDSCGHVHTRYYWSAAGLEEVFRHAHSSQLADAGGTDAKRIMWAPVIDKAIALLQNGAGFCHVFGAGKLPIWLDVGCGDGALVMTASDFGFNAVGLDARAQTVQRIRELGFNAQQGDFMKIDFDGQPDVLSMMDVLEHMPYPKEALHKAAQVMKKGSVIVISVPDMSCSSWRMMDAAQSNPYWIEMEHHHNFGRMRLLSLLQEWRVYRVLCKRGGDQSLGILPSN